MHCAQVIHYSIGQLETEVHSDVLDLSYCTKARFEVFDAIMNFGEAQLGIFFRLKWDSLPEESYWTSFTVPELYQNLPGIVLNYMKICSKH